MASINIIHKLIDPISLETLNVGQLFKKDHKSNVFLKIKNEMDGRVCCYDLSANLICNLNIDIAIEKVEADLVIK